VSYATYHYTTVAVPVPGGSEVTLKTVDGTGRLVYTSFRTINLHLQLRVYSDEVLALILQPSALNEWGYTANSPGKQLLMYDTVNNDYRGACTIPLTFRRQLRIAAYCDSDTLVYLGSTIVHLQV